MKKEELKEIKERSKKIRGYEKIDDSYWPLFHQVIERDLPRLLDVLERLRRKVLKSEHA